MPTQVCPICEVDVKPNPRYPSYICRGCLAQGVEVNGETVLTENLDIWSKPFEIECIVAGVRCVAREAHFGGCVVEPATD